MGYRPTKALCDLNHKMAVTATLCFSHARRVSDRLLVSWCLPPLVSGLCGGDRLAAFVRCC